jgi:hypothetical protein
MSPTKATSEYIRAVFAELGSGHLSPKDAVARLNVSQCIGGPWGVTLDNNSAALRRRYQRTW